MTTPAVGNGTTTTRRADLRWRKWRWAVPGAAVTLLAALVTVLPAPTTSRDSMAPDNPGPDGGRALAEVLTDQGVRVEYVRTTAEAVAAAQPGTTLLVTTDYLLTIAQQVTVATVGADLVLMDSPMLMGAVTTELESGWTSSVSIQSVPADCDDPDATAAGTLSGGGSGVTGSGSAVLCFPTTTEALGTTYLYGSTEAAGRRVTVIGDPWLFSNDRIADEGNAALALRTLGRNQTLIWFIPSANDAAGAASDTDPSPADLLPPEIAMLLVLLMVTVVMFALWRGRRLGPVVAEQLPVVVRPGETTRGRARLYRRGAAHGHAAAALRAGVAVRCARLLGIPRSAAPDQFTQAVAQATGRTPEQIAEVFHGPPPTDDNSLHALARQLDEIESEVHHP